MLLTGLRGMKQNACSKHSCELDWSRNKLSQPSWSLELSGWHEYSWQESQKFRCQPESSHDCDDLESSDNCFDLLPHSSLTLSWWSTWTLSTDISNVQKLTTSRSFCNDEFLCYLRTLADSSITLSEIISGSDRSEVALARTDSTFKIVFCFWTT